MSDVGRVVLVHPENVNLADVKAKAAEHNATVMGNPFVPRGKVFIFNSATVVIGG